jgi:predicted membrane-bound mannosyltransferase
MPTTSAYLLATSSSERTRLDCGAIIEPNMRAASLIVLSGLCAQVAHADEIRHATFPNVMLGTWAEQPNSAPPKTKLTS